MSLAGVPRARHRERATVTRLVDVDRGDLCCTGDILVKGKSQATRVYDCFGADAPDDERLKRSTAKDFSEGVAAWQAADSKPRATHFNAVVTLHPAMAPRGGTLVVPKRNWFGENHQVGAPSK